MTFAKLPAPWYLGDNRGLLKRLWCWLFHRGSHELPWGEDRTDWTWCDVCKLYSDRSSEAKL